MGLVRSVAVAWAISLAGQASVQAQIPCRSAPGTTTIGDSTRARIFEDEREGNDYACLYSDGHAHYLSSSEHYEYRLVRFAGSYVGYVQNIEGEDNVGVMNLRTGRVGYYEVVRPIDNAICPQVDSLVLKSDGAVAWIATNFLAEEFCDNPPGPTIEVRLHDRYGLRVVDSGTGIVPTSLHLSGSMLRWVDAGSARSATLH